MKKTKNARGTSAFENEFFKESLEIAKQNGLKTKILGEDLYIDSIFDSWYIADVGKYVELHHKNTLNKNYHLQRRFTNIMQAVDSVVKHDTYKLNRNYH